MALDPRLSALSDFIRALDAARAQIANLEHDAVALARAYGATWEQIGEELGGISRQAAKSRYEKPRRRRC